jgi:hypothetical protein
LAESRGGAEPANGNGRSIAGDTPPSIPDYQITQLPDSRMITPTHYMLLSAALFIIGVIGVMVRRNIIIFMSID